MKLLNPTHEIGGLFTTKRNLPFWGATVASLAGTFHEPSYVALRTLDKISGLPVTFAGLSARMSALGGCYAYTVFTSDIAKNDISPRRHNCAVIAGAAAGLYVSAATLAHPKPDMNVAQEANIDMGAAAVGAALFVAVNLVTRRAHRPTALSL